MNFPEIYSATGIKTVCKNTAILMWAMRMLWNRSTIQTRSI